MPRKPQERNEVNRSVYITLHSALALHIDSNVQLTSADGAFSCAQQLFFSQWQQRDYALHAGCSISPQSPQYMWGQSTYRKHNQSLGRALPVTFSTPPGGVPRKGQVAPLPLLLLLPPPPQPPAALACCGSSGGTSSAGLDSKNPTGLSAKPIWSHGMTG